MSQFAAVCLALLIPAVPVGAAGLTGRYVETRTCDVYTGPCFANAEMNLGGRNALLAWKVEQGSLDHVRLDGLSVVAVVEASDTLGLFQQGPARAVLIVDAKADAAQRDALVRLAQRQGGELLGRIISVETAPIDIIHCPCKANACTIVKAGPAHVETRCLDDRHDRHCGNESAFYPPLAQGVKAAAAMVTAHGFNGQGLNGAWKEADRRGAYVGTFEIR